MRRDVDYLALTMKRAQGKPLGKAKEEMLRSGDFLEGAASRLGASPIASCPAGRRASALRCRRVRSASANYFGAAGE